MKINKISKVVLWGVIILIGLMVLGWWGLGIFEQRNWFSWEDNEIKSCGKEKQFFSDWPVDVKQLVAIMPLGSMNPRGGSVFPLDRILWLTKNGEGVGGSNNSVEVQVYAPGEVWVTSVAAIEYWSGNIMVDKDYLVNFSPCQEVEAGFYHLRALEPRVMEAAQINYQDQISYRTGGLTVRVREAKVKLKFQSGEVIGWAGGATERRQAFDWGMVDERIKPLVFAHASTGGSKLAYTVCPLDYYADNERNELAALLGSTEKKRVEEPVCGQVNQDLVGILQGRWYAEKTERERGQDKHIALVHDVIEPQRPVLSIGTSLVKSGLVPGLYYFKLKSAGTINRDFSEVNETGVIYCYQGMQDERGEATKRILLVELIDDKSVKVEARPGFSCASSNYIFSDRMTVFER